MFPLKITGVDSLKTIYIEKVESTCLKYKSKNIKVLKSKKNIGTLKTHYSAF